MTKPELILMPQARRHKAGRHVYRREQTQSSRAFRQTLQHIYEVLLDLLEVGSVRNFRSPEMKGLRMLPVPKFKNYLLFYRPTTERLEIVRVLHGARDVSSLFGE